VANVFQTVPHALNIGSGGPLHSHDQRLSAVGLQSQTGQRIPEKKSSGSLSSRSITAR
jgi:hypothetical protein